MIHTMKDILDSISVRRLKGILQSRYGTGLQVDFITDLESVDRTSGTPSLNEGVLRIPLYSENQYLAQAKLPEAYGLDFEEQETVSDLVKMVLEPLLNRWHEQQQQARFEAKINADSGQAKISHLNVVSLFKSPQSATQDADEIRSFSTPAMYLESSNSLRREKIAHEIHDVSGRWACVPFESVAANLATVEDIKSLGAMTLIIGDILNLTPSQSALLSSFLASKPEVSSPLLLLSSSTPLRDLLEQKILTPELNKLVQNCVVEVDRLPQKKELLQETLELFLEPIVIL